MIASILIPIYNRLQITQEGLLSLKKALKYYNEFSNNHINFKIVVIDDGSTDGSSKWIRENYPDVYLLQGDGNLWWSGAINLGAKYAFDNLKTDFVLLWNDDLILKEDYFCQLENIIKNDEFLDSIVSSKVYYQIPDDKIFYFGASFNFVTGKKDVFGYNKADGDEYQTVRRGDWTGGMGVLIPKIVFDSIGYFDDKKFPQYYGDADFTLRANKKGFKIFCHPGLQVWNDRDQTSISHNGSLKGYFKSLASLRSNHNLSKDITFYFRYTSAFFAVIRIVDKHLRHFVKFLIAAAKKRK